MEALLRVLSCLTPVCYLVAAVVYLRRFYRGKEVPLRVPRVALHVALVVHAIFFGLQVVYGGFLPLTNVYQVLSGIGLALVLIYVTIEWRIGQTSTGFFPLAIAVLFTGLAAFFFGEGGYSPVFGEPVFAVHVFTGLIGHTAAAVAAVYGLLYLLLYRQLKVGQFGTFYRRLPPLEILERITDWSILVAFVNLSIALPLAFLWLHSSKGTYSLWDGKILATVTSWVLFGLVWASRRWFGLSARRLAYGSLLGFAIVLVSMIVVNLFFSDFHRFG